MYLNLLNNINFIEILLQVFLLYNITQIIKQNNFYYLFFYFVLVILYFGLFLIIYDLDLSAVILWIIYGGLCIIFFIYSLMWFDVYKNFYKYLNLKINFFLFLLFFFFLFFFNSKNDVIFFFLKDNFYINFYILNSKNIINELEIVGWGIIYYNTFIFLIISYFLLINCIIVVTLIINSKKLKNNLLNYLFIYFQKKKNLFFLNFLKFQYFFIQDYENLYQKNTLNKNFKISNYFHQMKNVGRRV